jgi:hypothetical protein
MPWLGLPLGFDVLEQPLEPDPARLPGAAERVHGLFEEPHHGERAGKRDLRIDWTPIPGRTHLPL